MMPAPMIAPTAAPAFSTSSNAASATCASCGLGSELDRDLGDDREQALAAGDEREQVVAGAVERLAAELDDLAGDQHAAHAAHVVHGEPVLEAMHAARVLGDVAADRAGDLRRRIGRVVEAVRRGGLGDREIAHAGLHDRGARERVDREDALELGERQHDAARIGQRAARQAGAGAARDHRDARRVARLQDRDDLRLVLRAAPPPRAARGTASARRTRTASCPRARRAAPPAAGSPPARRARWCRAWIDYFTVRVAGQRMNLRVPESSPPERIDGDGQRTVAQTLARGRRFRSGPTYSSSSKSWADRAPLRRALRRREHRRCPRHALRG